MKTFDWRDWQNKAPLSLRRGTRSVKLSGLNQGGEYFERTSVTIALQYNDLYFPSLHSVHDRIHRRVEGRFLLASLPDKRGLICLDENARILMITARVRTAKRTKPDDFSFVQGVADSLATAAVYALGDMVAGSTHSASPSFEKVLIRSRQRRIDFFHINVSDAAASLDREHRLAA